MALTERRAGYALAALTLLLTETLIAIFVHDRLVRPHVGDILVVILIYLVLRTATPLDVIWAAVIAFAIACMVEISQFFDLVTLLGLGTTTLARIVLGTHFDLIDILCYATGAVFSWIGEWAWARRGHR